MTSLDSQYKNLVNEILGFGITKSSRTGINTKSLFGKSIKVNLKEGFPLLTLKETHFKSVLHELLWFLNSIPAEYQKFGNTNIKYLVDNKVNIWNEWAFKTYEEYIAFLNNAISVGKANEDFYKDTPFDNKSLEEILSNHPVLTQKEFVQKIREDDEFALKWGELGPVYGKQWTRWGEKTIQADLGEYDEISFTGINQIQRCLDILKYNPDDRGIIISGWNVSELHEMALRPCHTLYQFLTEPLSIEERLDIVINSTDKYSDFKPLKGSHSSNEQTVIELDRVGVPQFKLNLHMFQRSSDVPLGLPFNIASCGLLLSIISQCSNMIPNDLLISITDAHIYENQIEGIKEVLNRTGFDLPSLEINSSITNINEFRFEDFKVNNYQSEEKIKMPVAV